MSIKENYFGTISAYLPSVRIVDPACVDYPHYVGQGASDEIYRELCSDIIRGCDMGISQLQEMRNKYEKLSVMSAMGTPYKIILDV